MSVRIKSALMKVKNSNGEYVDLDTLAVTQTTQEAISEIESAVAGVQDIVDDAETRAATVASTVSAAETAITNLNNQKNDIVQSVASMAELGTDTTLTVAGMAADAKATGDAVNGLKSAITDIDPESIDGSNLTINLINKNRCIVGKYVNYTNGELADSSSYTATDYIPIVANGYCMSAHVEHYAIYDENKVYISGQSSNLNSNKMPANAAFIRVDFANANADNAYVTMGIYGKASPEFVVEYPWLDSSRKISADRLEQNGAHFVNLFNKYTAEDGVYVESTTGEKNAAGSYFTSDLIKVKPNTVYVMSVGNRYAAYDENLQYISGENLSGVDKEFTTPNNAKYIRVCNTPIALKDIFVVADKKYYTGAGEGYGIFVPWIKGDKSKYDGKTLVCFGDSITNMGYTNTIKRDTGINAINVGLSSGRYAYSDDSNQYVNAFAFHNIIYSISTGDWTIPDTLNGVSGYETQYAHIQDIKNIDFDNVDFVSIAYGTNDFSSATPLDNESNPLDTNTFKGAIRYCLKLLTEKYPHLKIVGVTPCYRFWSENGTILYDSDEHAVSGLYLNQYVQAVEDVYTEYHLPVVNNYTNAGINKYNRLQYFSISDGLHPNAKGRAVIGHRIGNGILANY